jgi:hypothetical protein
MKLWLKQFNKIPIYSLIYSLPVQQAELIGSVFFAGEREENFISRKGLTQREFNDLREAAMENLRIEIEKELNPERVEAVKNADGIKNPRKFPNRELMDKSTRKMEEIYYMRIQSLVIKK